MAEIGKMNLKRFEKWISSLSNLFRGEGFCKDPDKFEMDVFVKFIDYHSQAIIIISRLKEDIARHESFTKYLIECVEEKKEISQTKLAEFGPIFSTLILDLSDFYIYTRMFLDTLTVCIKLSFKSAGNKNSDIMKHSVRCLLNEDKMHEYKSKIDSGFFESIEKKITWIKDIRKYRNGLVHQYCQFVFALTRQGELGYDLLDRTKTSWGTDTVRGLMTELQNTIDNLTDLIEYLLVSLPRKTERTD